MTTSKSIEAIVEGLRHRVLALEQAEDRLARFAFTEGPAEVAIHNEAPEWRPFVLRTLAVAGDPENYTVLERLVRDGDASLTEVGRWLRAGRLAVIDRINLLTHTGCLTRDLERDLVGATPLARGLVELVQELVESAAAGKTAT